MNFAEAVKKCSMEAYGASIPCDAVTGEVEEAEPLVVRVGEMQIPSEILYVSEQLLYKEQEIRLGTYERTVVIHDGIKKGDRLILLRKSGGEGYFAIGKI